MKETVLVVEDNDMVRTTIQDFLSLIVDTNLVKVLAVDNAVRAKELVKKENISLIITDINLGTGPDGLSLADDLKTSENRPYILVISSIPGMDSTEKLIKVGKIDAFLGKPFTLQKFKKTLEESKVLSLKNMSKPNP